MDGDEAALRAVRGRHARDAPWLTATRTDMPALPDTPRRPRIVALVPAYNEEDGIGAALESLVTQTRQMDEIIVIPNSNAGHPTDRTADIAREFPVTVMEFYDNEHRKSGALNMAWHASQHRADLFVFIDGDTVLPPHAIADWEAEFAADDQLGGSSSQPIMVGGKHWNLRPFRPLERAGRLRQALHWAADRTRAVTAAVMEWYLPRLQWFEFGRTINQRLACGWVLVVSGTGCCFRAEALRDVAQKPGRPGPWVYESVVEDYHLTYEMRRAGWKCRMSPTVWCWTGAMLTLKSLWYQRIKWTGGTDDDLLKFGFDSLNYRQWLQNVLLGVNVTFMVLWLALEVPEIITGGFHWIWWWQLFGAGFALIELAHMSRLRGRQWGRDRADWLLAGLLVHLMIYNVLSVSWGVVSWWKVLYRKLGDLWTSQYRAEGMASEKEKIGTG